MRDRHTALKVLPQDNGEEFFSDYLFAQRERNRVFGKHETNSRCQCNKCAANPVPLPHIQDGIIDLPKPQDAATIGSEEESFGVADEAFDLDFAAATPPPTVASDPTSLENFRKHQELNRPMMPIIPRQIFYSMPTAAPIPVFHASAQNVFAFPYHPYHYVPAPAAVMPKEPKKRKYKNHETEFKCVCEKERFLSRKSGPTRHSNVCKVKRLRESAI
jgi:hypothetical protein